MSNRYLGQVVHFLHEKYEGVRRWLNNEKVYYEIGGIVPPFDIDVSVELRSPAQIKLDKDCVIKARAILNGRSSFCKYGVELGENTYVKENCYFDAYDGFIRTKGFCAFGQNTIIHGGGGVEIGKYVITGANCYIISSNHQYTSQDFPIMLQGDRRKGIVIGENVWLGGSVIVLDGVNIGSNSVIGAGTVLTKSIPKNSVVYNDNNVITKTIYK